ncbi:MAG: periplasmic heavy metal sensor [Cyclobacteriaceae bacterium]
MQKRKLKLLTIGVLALMAINLALISFIILGPKLAVAKYKRQGVSKNIENRDKGARFLIQELDLSKEQQQAFRSLFQDHRKLRDSLDIAIRKNKALLVQSSIDPEVNSVDQDSLIEVIAQSHMLQERAMAEHFTKMKALCNQDQVERLSRLIERSHTNQERRKNKERL